MVALHEPGGSRGLERDVPVWPGPTQIGPHQIHAYLSGLRERLDAARALELFDRHAVRVGHGVDDAPGLGHLSSLQACQGPFLVGGEGCHMVCPPVNTRRAAEQLSPPCRIP